MSKLWLKGCPLCRGDLYEEPAIGLHQFASRYVTCLQCGHVLSEAQELNLLQERALASRAPSRVA